MTTNFTEEELDQLVLDIKEVKKLIAELKEDPYKGMYKRKYIQAQAEIAELKKNDDIHAKFAMKQAKVIMSLNKELFDLKKPEVYPPDLIASYNAVKADAIREMLKVLRNKGKRHGTVFCYETDDMLDYADEMEKE